MQVQTDVVQHRISLGQSGRLSAAPDVSAEVKARSEPQLDHGDVAEEERARGTSSPVESSIGGGADSGWIAQSDGIRIRFEIEDYLPANQIGMTGESYGAASGTSA